MDIPPSGAKNAGIAFPSYHVAAKAPVWNDAERGLWQLEVSGLVDRPLKLTLADLAALPRISYRLDHFCVEGWNAVATRTGVRLSEIARLVGVRPDAHYVDFQSFDRDPQTSVDYHESWDIESAMHPQTLVVYAQDGQWPERRAPCARLLSPLELGYKNTKYLTRIRTRRRSATVDTGPTSATSGTAESSGTSLKCLS